MINIVALLIVMLPLASAVINGFGYVISCEIIKERAGLVAGTLMSVLSLLSLYLFYYSGLEANIINLKLCPWLKIYDQDISWSIYIDQLTALMLVVVNLVSTVVHIYSLGYMSGDRGLPKFLAYLSLFTFFMLMLVASDNFLQLFFGWEGVGLCSYLLIGYWYEKDSANSAATKAFIVNRISDVAFTIAIISIVISTNAADFINVFESAVALQNENIPVFANSFTLTKIDIICLLLMIGCMGKSAQIGLHIWLPDAMEGPTPVSALIHAATMVTAGIFLIARCGALFSLSPIISNLIIVIGTITCLFGAVIATRQSDIKKIIAYSTCSQLGYMFLACGLKAYNLAIFHLATHAFFKALLFLSAGTIIHNIHEQDINKMGGLKNLMPVTYGNFWIASLALIGIMPFAGFYSKDLILEAAYGHHNIVFWLGILGAFFTALYSMKIIIKVFHGKRNMNYEIISEAPGVMHLPLIILSAGTLFSGMFGYYILNLDKNIGYFDQSIIFSADKHIHMSLALKLAPVIFGLMGIVIALFIYNHKMQILSKINFKFIDNKFYFDEIYNYSIIKPLKYLSVKLGQADNSIVDKYSSGLSTRLAEHLGYSISKIQTGYIYNYNFYIGLSLIAGTSFLLINYLL